MPKGGVGGGGDGGVSRGDVCGVDPAAVAAELNCGSDGDREFRRIDGTCNNVGRPVWGSAYDAG